MSDDEAIKYLCQYQSAVKIIVVEVNEKTCAGEMVIKYAFIIHYMYRYNMYSLQGRA